MAIPLLSECAEAQLEKLTVNMLPVKPIVLTGGSAGSSWNVGELGLVYVEIINTCGAPLRDVYVKTWLWSEAAQYEAFGTWNGNGGAIGDLDIGATWKNYIALLKAVAPGPSLMFVLVSAEVVAYGSPSSPPYQLTEVYPQ